MILSDPTTLSALLKRHGLRADKSLGQHFLVSTPVVEAIVEAAADCRGILEIGPGPGVLTGPLSARAERTIALELDSRFLPVLGDSAPKAEVRQQDALDANLQEILAELPSSRAVVSNLPYYITGPLLQRIAAVASSFDVAVLMMQKEVGARIMAPPGDGERGSLSVYLQSLFQMSRVARVPAGAFLPPPKVDSVVLALRPNGQALPENVQRLVRLAFAQPRKTLANNLAAGLRLPRDTVLDVLEGSGFREKSRAQELSLDDWRRLGIALDKQIPRA